MLGKTRAVLIGVVLVAVAMNVVQFRAIDAGADPGYSALSRLSSTDIMKDAVQNQAMARTYGMYLSLAEVAPGAQLVVSPSDKGLVAALGERGMGLGQAKEVRVVEFDDNANRVLSPDDLISMPEKYQLAASGTETVDGKTSTLWQIVTGACSADSGADTIPQFAVMTLTLDGSSSLLLIETCLLPEGTVSQK